MLPDKVRTFHEPDSFSDPELRRQILHIRAGDYVVWTDYDHSEGSGTLLTWRFIGAGQGSEATIVNDDGSESYVDPIYFTHIIAGGLNESTETSNGTDEANVR